jgi:hypothetical protein
MTEPAPDPPAAPAPTAQIPTAQIPNESPEASRDYPTDASVALQRGQEAYETTRQGEIDPGAGVPRSERTPRDISGASSGLTPGGGGLEEPDEDEPPS